MQLYGTLNLLFYPLLLCDSLTLTLPQRFVWLDVLPFFLALFDFLENLLLYILLGRYPSHIPGLGMIVSSVSLCKSLLLTCVLLLLTLSLLTLPFRKRGEKQKTQ